MGMTGQHPRRRPRWRRLFHACFLLLAGGAERGGHGREGLDGLQVFAREGNDYREIGEIDAFDAANNSAIVSVGGFLGIGERQVAYPLDQISFQRTAAGDLEAYVGTPADQVQNLPAYTAPAN